MIGIKVNLYPTTMMAQQGITIGYQKMKKLTMALLLVPTIVFAQDKYYDRNQLPQLNQEILEQSQFEFTATEVPVSSLIPVQTQRVRDLKKQEKNWNRQNLIKIFVHLNKV